MEYSEKFEDGVTDTMDVKYYMNHLHPITGYIYLEKEQDVFVGKQEGVKLEDQEKLKMRRAFTPFLKLYGIFLDKLLALKAMVIWIFGATLIQ